MNIQGRGQEGLENQANRGFQASSGLADFLGNAAGAQGGLSAFTQDRANTGMNSGLSMLSELIKSGKLKIPGVSGRCWRC